LLYKKSLFIFRRDLRLQDNHALNFALQESEQVVPVFIFDDQQVTSKNKYLSHNAMQFMLESLHDLSEQIKNDQGRIYFFNGISSHIITKLISEIKIEAIYTNKDYTPFSINRDDKIKTICDHAKIDFKQYEDALLNSPDLVKNGSKQVYKVFTAFYKNAHQITVALPQKHKIKPGSFYNKPIPDTVDLSKISHKLIKDPNPQIAVNGGTANGLKILSKLSKFKNYDHDKDFPCVDTTHLGAHLKFGTVSVREAFYAIVKHLGQHHPLLRQLYWRDFFTYVAYHQPKVFGHAFNPKYDHIKWHTNTAKFKLWSTGQTGFPIVDAGIRQLNATGFMHNRVRMIVASFLVKDLHLDWRLGEHYFATKLTDYDPAVNNGNWQWCASTGCDAQPYFRIFNPWLQQKKFDPDCVYIKTWIPELKNVAPKIIHNWVKTFDASIKYPAPILDHSIEAKIALKMY